MENMVLSSEDADLMKQQIVTLQTQLENAALNFADETSLLQMITEINRRINQIVDGTIPTEVQYNTNVIHDGLGTTVDKSVPNKIKINNNVYGYKLLTLFDWDNLTSTSGLQVTAYDASNALNKGIFARLKPFENMMRVNIKSGGSVANNDVNIYIDDSTASWKDGQTLKLVFDNIIEMNGYNINIYTDKKNGWSQVAQIVNGDLRNGKPYIEIVCTNQATLTFVADVLR